MKKGNVKEYRTQSRPSLVVRPLLCVPTRESSGVSAGSHMHRLRAQPGVMQAAHTFLTGPSSPPLHLSRNGRRCIHLEICGLAALIRA
eukprot:scaffold222412_cov59-Attheya_sp.AAC.3